MRDLFGIWCNGSTAVFGAVSRGSNPLSPTTLINLKSYPSHWSVKIDGKCSLGGMVDARDLKSLVHLDV